MRDEARRILEDQNQPPKLHRLACLAPLVQLRVRFKQAEQLLGVGNLFSLQHSSPRRIPHLLRTLQKHAYLVHPFAGDQGTGFRRCQQELDAARELAAQLE